jgi:oxygen-independent coproporphyrinogen-3 oxidase
MAGIYLHIPFCKKACHYCDFHFSTTMKNKDELIAAMHKELDLRKDYLQGEKIKTIYFGGGTPSVLESDEIKRILDHIHRVFEVEKGAEVTLEANPDDLTPSMIRGLKESTVNRLSIGIQSFRDEDLKMMNRAHNASQADYAVKASQDGGFENITIDLIYSIPGLSMREWKMNLETAIQLHVQHISAYSLTIEPGTVFGNYQSKGKLIAVDQDFSGDQFLTMIETLNKAGFDQYEVSNFCLPDFESKHNSAYWNGARYLGIGPSAHSFDGESRQWNIANNSVYVRFLEKNEMNFEREILDERTRINEYIMTGLRTKWGIDNELLRSKYHFDLFKEYEEMIFELKHKGKLNIDESTMRLTKEGLLMADRIASDFFIV